VHDDVGGTGRPRKRSLIPEGKPKAADKSNVTNHRA
jgi:hypothetical protein